MPNTEVLVVGTPTSCRAAVSARLQDHHVAHAEASDVRVTSSPALTAESSRDWMLAQLTAAAAPQDQRVLLCVSGPLTYAAWCHATTPETMIHACAAWNDEHRMLLHAALGAGRPVLVVRSEALETDAAGTLARAAAFAGLPPLTRDGGALHPTPPPYTLTAPLARAAMRALAASEIASLLGYDVALPPLPTPRTAGERHILAAWVEDELTLARDATLMGEMPIAVETLKLLLDYFGTEFDTLGLDLTYEGLAITLTDILLSVELPGPAAIIAQGLVANRPESLEGHRLLLLAALGASDIDGAMAAATRFLRLAVAEENEDTSHAPDLVRLLHHAQPDNPATPAFIEALAAHRPMAAAVEMPLAAAPPDRRPPHSSFALGLLAAARGRVEDGVKVLE